MNYMKADNDVAKSDKAVGRRFHSFLKSKGLKQKEFGKQLKMSQQTISSYCRNGKIPYHILLVLKSVFNLNIDWLLLGEGPREIADNADALQSSQLQDIAAIYQGLSEEKKRDLLNYAQRLKKETNNAEVHITEFRDLSMMEVPFLGNVQTGKPIPHLRQWSGERVAIPSDILPTKNSEDYFCFQAQNNSMEDCGIYANDYVVFMRKNVVEQGKVATAISKGKVFIARIFSREDYTELHFCAPEKKVVKVKNPEDYRIEGVMVGLYRKVFKNKGDFEKS